MPSAATVTIPWASRRSAASTGEEPLFDATANYEEVKATIAVDTTGGTVSPFELGLTSFQWGQVERATGVTAGSATAQLGAITSSAFTVGNETATYYLTVRGPSRRQEVNS